ncbi:MAG: acyltransferase family protein [Chakrabartia godavariana]
MNGQTLGAVMSGGGGRDNAFDTIRLLAATSVIISHAFVLVDGREAVEPLYRLTGGQITIGRAAVAAFFVVSGLLISMSFDRSRSMSHFAANRAFRLFPGLWMCVFVLVFIAGPLLTTMPLPVYVRGRETLGFLGNLLFFPLSQSVGGVFDGWPGSNAMNGSLWTLKYEVACYALGALLLSCHRHRAPLVAICWVAAMIAMPLIGDPLQQKGAAYYLSWMIWLFRYYGAGMLLYLLRDRLPISKGGALGCLFGTVGGLFTPYFTELLATCGAYALIVSAYLAVPWFKRLTAGGDLSYGVYIYAFPVQQALVPYALGTPVPWLTNILLATPATFVLAALSWHVVERPALKMKGRIDRNTTRVVV